jgi:topoisomerase IA-like protein
VEGRCLELRKGRFGAYVKWGDIINQVRHCA